MKLLNTYDDRDEAEEAAEKLTGDKRLASERDASVVIYNLFGIPSWGNFHRLGMYNPGHARGSAAVPCPREPAQHLESEKVDLTVEQYNHVNVP